MNIQSIENTITSTGNLFTRGLNKKLIFLPLAFALVYQLTKLTQKNLPITNIVLLIVSSFFTYLFFFHKK